MNSSPVNSPSPDFGASLAHSRANRPLLTSEAFRAATQPPVIGPPAPLEPARTLSPDPSPWRQPFTPPVYSPGRHQFSPPRGFHMPHEAVDYFAPHTQRLHSKRAPANLALVVGGRIAISLGLAGVYSGFQESPFAIGLGTAGLVLGAVLIGFGACRFYVDTAQYNRRLARLAFSALASGTVLATGGGVFNTWALARELRPALYTAVAVRTAGNVLLFAALPAGFTATEITWGDTPIANRVALRDGAYAHGVAFLMAWAHIASPDPPAPLWTREALQCLGIALVATGASLARTDITREQAHQRAVAVGRRATLSADHAATELTDVSPTRRVGDAPNPPASPPRPLHQRGLDFVTAVVPGILGRLSG